MSEEGGGKMKAKKVHSQSKPYERRKSLFGKVTDTIKEVIAPSWLSDLVKSVKRTSPHKDEDDSKEEPRQEVKSTSQSLMRSRYQRDGPPQFVPLNSNGIPRLSHKATDQSQVNKPPYTTLSRPDDNPSCAWSLTPQTEISHGNADEKMERNDAAPLGNCTRERPKLHHLPESSQTKEKSQVGLGSLPQDDVDQSADEMSQNCNYDESEITMETSHLEKSVTWTEGYKNSRLSRNKPGFDISLFGLPSRNNFLSKSFHESSFYPGKTVYGGASSGSSSSRLNATAPYQTGFPIRQKIKVKPANTSGSATTCSTAQKILETLEKMSTPLSDARKIPVDDDTVLKMSTRSYLTPGSYKKSRSSIGTYLDTRRELQTTGKGPPKSNISMSTSASISKNYQKISTPHVDSKKDENTSKNMPQKSLQDSISLPSSTGLGGGKLKNKKFQQHIPGRKALEEEDVEVEVPNLRTDFTLPVKDMPKFNFSSENVPSRSKTLILDPGNGHQLDPGNGHHPADSPFTFAPPIQKTPTKPGQEPKPTKMNYTFSQPLDADSTAVVKSVTFDIKPDDRKELNFSSPPGFKFGSSLNTPTRSSGALGSSPVLPSAGLKAASELKSGSVMDVLGKLDKSSENNFKGFLPANELKKGSVMDILGKSGDLEDDKPASELKAGSVMEVLGREGKSESTAQPSLSAMFKPEPGSWRCDTCLIVNKVDITKCPACQTPKPGESKSTAQPSLSAMFKPEPGSWRCDTCLIVNKADITKCPACQTPKPGKTDSTTQPSLSAMFKPEPGSWRCDTCLIVNKADIAKCPACQTPKPGKSESTTQPSLSAMFKPEPGSWRCDTCLIVNKADITKCPACQTPKPGKASSATATSLPSLSSIFKTEAGSWNCDVCLVNNKAEVSKCVACQSGKPGAAPQKEADNSLAAKFKKPTGSWDCDTCLVLNKAEATKCIACETPRPGLQSSFTGGFKFGTGSSFSGQKGFVFGNVDSSLVTGDKPSEQESDNKKLTSINKTTESVGSTNNSGNVSSSKGGFIFGISSSASVTSGSQLDTPTNTSVTSSKGGFQFGTSSNTTVPSGFQFGTSTNTSVVPTTGGFKFSASNSTNEAPAASGFQLSNKESSVSSIVKTSTDSTTTKLSVTTGFSFGTKDGDKPEKGFKFGTSEAVKSAAPSTGEFKFGVQETSGTGFQFGVKTAANTVTTEGKDGISEASASTFKSIFGVDKAEMQDLYPSGKPAITNQPSSINFGSGAGFTFGTSAQQPSVDLGVDDVKQSKKEDTKPLTSTESTLPTFNFQNNVKSSQKRALDTENGPSDAKKPIFTVNSESSQSKDTGGGFDFSATTPKVPAKFGSNTTSTVKPTPAPGGFNFGQTTTTSASTAPGFGSNTAATGFSFGGANNAEKSNNTPFNVNRASSTPVFGNTAPSTTPASGTFVFGEPTTTTASTFTFTAQASTNQARAAASPFGAPQSNANGAVFGNSNSTFGNNTGTPSFGNSAPAFGNTAPSGFGTGSTPTPFGGGSTSAPVFGATPVTTTSGFSFSTNQSSFNFGTNVGTPAANGPGVFQFGAKPTENAVPAQPQGATTGFNFSQSQSLTTGTAFNFNASSSNNLFAGQNAVPGMPSPGSFTIGSTGNADQRKIKRAVRKIRR